MKSCRTEGHHLPFFTFNEAANTNVVGNQLSGRSATNFVFDCWCFDPTRRDQKGILRWVGRSNQKQDVEQTKRRRRRLPGLWLTAADQQAMEEKRSGGRAISDRDWQRIHIQEMLDQGWKLAHAEALLAIHPSEVL
jgi:hypothetical protein